MADNTPLDIHTETVTLNVSDGTTMPAYVARPQEGGTRPGLLVLQEAFGVNAHIRDVTERFARAGYTAVAPALFHRTDPNFEGVYTDFAAVRPHMQGLTDDGQSADIKAAYDWLKSSAGGGVAKIGSIGYCMGGRRFSPMPCCRFRHRFRTMAAVSRPALSPISPTCWGARPICTPQFCCFGAAKMSILGEKERAPWKMPCGRQASPTPRSCFRRPTTASSAMRVPATMPKPLRRRGH